MIESLIYHGDSYTIGRIMGKVVKLNIQFYMDGVWDLIID